MVTQSKETTYNYTNQKDYNSNNHKEQYKNTWSRLEKQKGNLRVWKYKT